MTATVTSTARGYQVYVVGHRSSFCATLANRAQLDRYLTDLEHLFTTLTIVDNSLPDTAEYQRFARALRS